MLATTCVVRAPAATLMMAAPARNLAFGDFVVFRDCCDNGNVDHGHGGFDGFAGAGALMTTPAAPCISATMASSVTRGPVVVPPPTPTNNGICATVSNACADHRFSSERVDGENGVGIGITDDRSVGGIGERFERMAFDCDAAAMLRYDCGYSRIGGGETTFDACGSITVFVTHVVAWNAVPRPRPH